TFQQGVGGYAGTVDTNLRGADPTTSYAVAKQLFTDTETGGAPGQALLRFDGLFGTGPGQIPLGATIVSASLTLQTSDTGDGGALHRMLRSWSDTDTWASLGSGIQADGFEALATADLVTGRMSTLGSRSFDVTTSVAAWAAGAANHGWAVLPLGTDGWGFQSAQGSTKPQLTIVFETGTTTPPASLALSGPLTQPEGNSGST
ncbi:DNRLRE domain-containing protein, partial [Falsiroseomonas oryziterrae]|uniref:DNRLRE domain-containing protein n=1 Tax=Falsiroseomonas oryziterrae TaxID=2911368 RepID=UPI001F1AD50C